MWLVKKNKISILIVYLQSLLATTEARSCLHLVSCWKCNKLISGVVQSAVAAHKYTHSPAGVAGRRWSTPRFFPSYFFTTSFQLHWGEKAFWQKRIAEMTSSAQYLQPIFVSIFPKKIHTWKGGTTVAKLAAGQY